MPCYGLFAPGNKAKKLATLDLVNVQFKIFFRLNTIRLCASLERAVSSQGFLPLERFPTAHQVTYNYYIGRLAIFDEDYVCAVCFGSRSCRSCIVAMIGDCICMLQLVVNRMPKASHCCRAKRRSG